MSYVDWMIEGVKVSACNRAWGCPCEFNAPPTYGVREGREAEMTSSTFKGSGALEFDPAGRHGFLVRYAYGPEGIID